MGIFNKKSSSSGGKIPPVDQNIPRQSPFGGGGPTPGPYGSRETAGQYGQQQPPQQGMRGAYGQPSQGSYYPQQQQQHQYGQSSQYGGQQQYGGGPGGYQQSSTFRDAKPPSSNFGAGYDAQYGGGSQSGRNQQLARNVGGRGGVEDDAEAEYGTGTAPTSTSNGYSNGNGAYDGMEQQAQQQDEEDDEVEAVKQQLRFTKQESLSSTRNALRIARETEETATGTVLKLGEQSDKIANTERHLDMSKAHSSRADDNAKEIVALNRSIFRPNIQFNKKAKRDAEEARILNRHIEEREEREAVRAEALKAQVRADQALTGAGTGSGRFADRFGGGRFGGSSSKALSPEEQQKQRLQQRSRYQFEATESDDELEGELEDNLDEIGALAGRLNQLGKSMGAELTSQNERLTRLNDKANRLDTRVYGSAQRLDAIGKK